MNRRHAVAAMLGIPSLPALSLAASDPDKFWTRVRSEQFALPDSRAFLNNGSLGIAPRPVLKAVEDYLERSAALMVPDLEYPRWGYETLDTHRQEVADYLGCGKDQLAFTHNATEGLSIIADGFDLKEGDEVVMTDQEHGSGKAGWHMRRARHGIAVKEVKIPVPAKDPAQLAGLMISAIGPRTRVMLFSGIVSGTGLVMPMKEICAAARAKGVIVAVDGAHVNGQIACRIADIGCDLWVGSPHKWMFAPAGCGILWGRDEVLDRMWPSIVTGGWDSREKKAARFMFVGTNNRALFEGMVAGVRFAKSLGEERIYARIHELAKYVRGKAAEAGFTTELTPDDDRLFGALVSFQLTGVNLDKFADLCKKRNVWISRGLRMRVSTHIHTRRKDVDLLFETLREARA